MTKPSVRIAEDEHGPRAAAYTVSGRIVDKRIVRGREHVEFESIGRDEAGQILFKTRRTHVLDLADRNAPRQGRGIDSGVKSEKI